MYDSPQIAQLPAWPAQLPVKDIAGNIDYEIDVLGLYHHTFDMGDILVSPDSATAHNTDGSPDNVTCAHDSLATIVKLGSACYHSHLPRNSSVVNYIVKLVTGLVARQRPKPVTPPPPTTTTTQAPPPTTASTVTSTPTTTGSLTSGSSFASTCVVAWPTAPTITSNSIQMTMSCNAVPESEYLFTVVTYDDPNLAICPASPDADVVGTISGTAQSEYGYKELLVQASSVKVQGQCES
jgi:hypothetical protein